MTKVWKSKTWQYEKTGTDGNTILFDVNIFDYEWHETEQSVQVRDAYGQEHKFPVYTVTINGQAYQFAAGELSNCVWGFFLEKY